MSVVAFHAMPNHFGSGFIGVDIFFVISGYLISKIINHQIENQSFNLYEFYARRIRRIFPALLLILITGYLFGWIFLFNNEYKLLGKHIATSSAFASNLALWQESGYFDTSAESKPLLHLWSLAVEEQVYIAWPIVMWAIYRLKISPIVATALIAGASLCLCIELTRNNPTAAFFGPHTRVWEFLCGGILAMISPQAEHLPREQLNDTESKPKVSFRYLFGLANKDIYPNLFSIAGLFFLSIGYASIKSGVDFPGAQAIFPVSAAILIIAAGPHSYINQHILSKRPLVWIGLISYPLYLWHWPLLAFRRMIIGTPPDAGTTIAIVLTSTALAWLTFKYLEMPIRRANQKIIPTRSLVLLMTIVGATGLITDLDDGLPLRQPTKSALTGQLGWHNEQKDSVCEKRFSANHSAEFCRISKDRDPTVILIGDSMAWQLFFGLAKQSEETNDTILTLNQGRCSGLFGLSDQIDFSKCEAVTQRALNIAANTPTIKTVILATSSTGTLNMSQLRVLDSQGGATKLPKSKSELNEFAKNSLGGKIMRLTELGKNVILVKNNPSANFPPAACIGRPLMQPDISTCSISQYSHAYATRSHNNMLEDVLRKFPHVRVIDLADLLCDKDRCWVMRDGAMLYRDQNHLSVNGSLLVGERLYEMARSDKDS
jgi:peptidoglycan/LPS O-acetylase OafA/YrhL